MPSLRFPCVLQQPQGTGHDTGVRTCRDSYRRTRDGNHSMGIKSVVFCGNYLQFSGAFEVFRNIARIAHAQGNRTAYLHHLKKAVDVLPDLSMFDEIFDASVETETSADEMGQRCAAMVRGFDIIHMSL